MAYSQEVSAKMLQVIANAKVAAKAAEEEYDRQADRAQELAMEGFRLGDNRNVSRAADLGAACRKACEGLYVAYQDLVRIIDEQCRPLLEQDPVPDAIRAVRDMIRWLNDESEIENNFTASFNGADLGDVICVRFSPNAASKMIQAHWDNVYMMHPGRSDFEAEEKRTELSAREIAANEARERYKKARALQEAGQETYKKELAAYQERAAQVRWLRSEETKRLEQELELRLRDPQLAPVHRKMEDAAKEKSQVEHALGEWQKYLADLGAFQIGAKMQAKKQIKELTQRLLTLGETMERLKGEEKRQLEIVASKVSLERPKLQKQAEDRYPMPEEPLPPGMNRQQMESKKREEAIIATLRKHKMLQVEELIEKCPALRDMSPIRVNAILRPMVGFSIRINEIKRMRFYEVREECFNGGGNQSNKEERERILQCIRENGHANITMISDSTYMNPSFIHAHLSKMVEEGLVVEYIYEKKGWYELF